MNVLIERSSKLYLDRMRSWVDVALEEGVRFFVTSLGNPRWVVERVAPVGGIVYHDVTERKWAEKGLAGGGHGLIAVNDRAGGGRGAGRAKHWMRTVYALRSAWQLKRASLAGGAREATSKDYWQAGKSVAGIDRVEPAGVIVRRFAAAALSASGTAKTARPRA